MTENPILQLSIIVCTYNRADILPKCLDSLADQKGDKSLYEVLVVDNNSSDRTAEIVQEYCSENKNFKSIFESEQGLSHARNRGAEESASKWIGYVDDDGWVDDDYILKVVETIENYNFDCFGGKVVNWFKFGRPSWYREVYQPHKEKYKEVCEIEGSVSGGIAFYKRDLILSLGGFSKDLGMVGKKISYGEEANLQLRIRKNGGVIGINPKIILHHLVPKYKLSIWWNFKSRYKMGLTNEVIHQDINKGIGNKLRYLKTSMSILKKDLRANWIKRKKDQDYDFFCFFHDSFIFFFFRLGKIAGSFKGNG